MGDIWLEDNDIYHPINVKSGLVGSEGQPNLVSLKKVLNAILSRWIDSYYLLIVKLEIPEPGRIRPTVYLVDMLNHLDLVTFDSGPGQIMLRARAFFSGYDQAKKSKVQPFGDKVSRLMDLLEDGERRLKANRERSLELFRARFAAYLESGDFTVTPETQEGLHLE
jgi:hypothetical protein